MRLRPCTITKPASAGSLSSGANEVHVCPQSLEVTKSAGPDAILSVSAPLHDVVRCRHVVYELRQELQPDPADTLAEILDAL